jgi:hypothetical protein
MKRIPNLQRSDPLKLREVMEWDSGEATKSKLDKKRFADLINSLNLRSEAGTQERMFIRDMRKAMERQLTMQEEYILWAFVQTFQRLSAEELHSAVGNRLCNVIDDYRLLDKARRDIGLTQSEDPEFIPGPFVACASGIERLELFSRDWRDPGGSVFVIPLAELDDALQDELYAYDPIVEQVYDGEELQGLLILEYPAAQTIEQLENLFRRSNCLFFATPIQYKEKGDDYNQQNYFHGASNNSADEEEP